MFAACECCCHVNLQEALFYGLFDLKCWHWCSLCLFAFNQRQCQAAQSYTRLVGMGWRARFVGCVSCECTGCRWGREHGSMRQSELCHTMFALPFRGPGLFAGKGERGRVLVGCRCLLLWSANNQQGDRGVAVNCVVQCSELCASCMLLSLLAISAAATLESVLGNGLLVRQGQVSHVYRCIPRSLPAENSTV